MKHIAADIFRRPFVRRVATMATGAAAAQAIAMAFAPLITRLYGPEAFGLQGIFLSVVGVLSVVAALGYPTAIVLPRSEAQARALVRLSLGLCAGAALLIALALLGFGARLLGWLNAQALEGFMFLIPLAVFGTVVGRVLGQWLVRRQAFGVTAASSVLSTVLVNMAKVALGVQMPSAAVLVATNTVGGLVGTALTYAGWRRVRGPAAPAPPNDAPASAWAMARAHRDFPLLRTPQDLINTLSQSLPVLLLAAYFGSAAAGHYGIALVVLGVPAALVGNAVMAVFYPRITQAVHDGEDARALILRATRGMVGTGAAPFLLLLLAGPTLFGWVFGPAWRPAGVYAQWLAPWLFMQFINQPAVSAIPALRLQRGLLIYELFSTGTKVLALWLGFVVFGSDVVAVALFSVFGALAYAWLIAWVLRNSRPRAGAPG